MIGSEGWVVAEGGIRTHEHAVDARPRVPCILRTVLPSTAYFGMLGAGLMESNHPRAHQIVILREHAFAANLPAGILVHERSRGTLSLLELFMRE